MNASRSLRGAVVAAVALVACHGSIRFDDSLVCAADGDCLLSTLHCDNTTGACVACTSDAHCTTPGLSRCDTAKNRCVECGLASDCPTGTVCHVGRCAPSCSSTVPCPPAAPVCDDQWCSQCDDGKGCQTSTVGPFCVAHSCSACATDANCTAPTPRCDTFGHGCVQCLANADCPAATPLCNLAAGHCAAVP